MPAAIKPARRRRSRACSPRWTPRSGCSAVPPVTVPAARPRRGVHRLRMPRLRGTTTGRPTLRELPRTFTRRVGTGGPYLYCDEPVARHGPTRSSREHHNQPIPPSPPHLGRCPRPKPGGQFRGSDHRRERGRMASLDLRSARTRLVTFAAAPGREESPRQPEIDPRRPPGAIRLATRDCRGVCL